MAPFLVHKSLILFLEVITKNHDLNPHVWIKMFRNILAHILRDRDGNRKTKCGDNRSGKCSFRLRALNEQAAYGKATLGSDGRDT